MGCGGYHGLLGVGRWVDERGVLGVFSCFGGCFLHVLGCFGVFFLLFGNFVCYPRPNWVYCGLVMHGYAVMQLVALMFVELVMFETCFHSARFQCWKR